MTEATASVDARQPRRAVQRAERQGAILGATIRILSGAGLAAVTHRAVAREAGVPLAATTYYFSSKDELVTEALAIFVGEEIARLRTRAEEMGEALASPGDAAADRRRRRAHRCWLPGSTGSSSTSSPTAARMRVTSSACADGSSSFSSWCSPTDVDALPRD